MMARLTRSWAALGVLIALLWIGLPLAARGDQTITRPYRGITYIDRLETAPRPIRLRVVQIDLTAPAIRFKLSPPGGSREVVRETTTDFLKRERAQIAINAHYFWPFPSTDTAAVVVGIAASDGTVYSAFESPLQSYALVTDAPGLNIDARNRATIVHHDRSKPDGLHVVEDVTLWNTLAGSAQIVTDGLVTIPVYADGDHRVAALLPGGPGPPYSNARSWYEAINARTAIGLSRDSRTLTLFTVDVRGGSQGMTVREVAMMLVNDYAVWQALNLDGGGSTTLAMEDPDTHERRIVNASSDSPGGRAVGSSLGIFAEAVR